MRKFTQFKESVESNKKFKVILQLEVEVVAKDSKLASIIAREELNSLIEDTQTDNIEFTKVATIIESKEIQTTKTNEAKTPNLAIMNTQKMMQDYLKNRGATPSDGHYKNLEKILGIFQSSNIEVFQAPAVIIEKKEESVPTNDIDDSIEWTKSLMKEFTKNGGKETSDQYQGYKVMLSMLEKIKKCK